MVTSLQGTVGDENKSKREPQGRLMNPITLYFQSLCELCLFFCISPYGSSQARYHRLHKSRPPGLIQELPLRPSCYKNHFSKPLCALCGLCGSSIAYRFSGRCMMFDTLMGNRMVLGARHRFSKLEKGRFRGG